MVICARPLLHSFVCPSFSHSFFLAAKRAKKIASMTNVVNDLIRHKMLDELENVSTDVRNFLVQFYVFLCFDELQYILLFSDYPLPPSDVPFLSLIFIYVWICMLRASQVKKLWKSFLMLFWRFGFHIKDLDFYISTVYVLLVL